MNPETVEPRLLNDDDWEVLSGPRARLPPQLGEPLQQSSDIPGNYRMLGHLLAAPGDSDVISQVLRVSSNETKIAPRSVPIVVGAAD